MPRLLVIDILDQPSVSFRERWCRFLALEALNPDWDYVDMVHQPESLATAWAERPSGVLISGSVRGIYENPPWLNAVADLIRQAHALSVPLLGICFGHQLLAHALGGRAEKAPAWEFGTLPVFAYPGQTHPWLAGFEDGTLTVQTHQDQVVSLPPGAVPLLFSRQTAYQAFSVGSCLGVQFHPEYLPEDLLATGRERAALFTQERCFHSHDHLNAYLGSLQPTHASRRVLRHFIQAVS
ncbi:MAG: type 1 glutamine amidotransferase [Candidatus Sericytochromatia bacterium]